MKWLTRLNPRNWFRRDMTAEQFQSLGLYAPPVAGIHLTPEVAAGVSAVYCADRVISEDLASLPMVVYRGDGPLDDESHPLLNDRVTRLLQRPNPEQTGPVFWSAFQHNANMWGFAVAEIVWDGAGRPAELWLVPSPTVRIDRDANGHLTFDCPGRDGTRAVLQPHDVLFLPGFSPDGSMGYRLLQTARMTIGTAAAIQTFAAARFRNGSRPSGAIKVKGVLSETARENMRASWLALYGGPNAAGMPLLLEDGSDWEKLEIAHNDQLQLADLMEQMVGEVSRFFNISPVKLHQLGRATWANLETLQRDHVITTLGPWIAKRDAEINAKLLGVGRHCRHVVDRMLAADTQTRFTAWNSAVTAGWMTPNEARRREDMAPKPGGDDLRLPLNAAPADQPDPSTDTEPPEPDPANPDKAPPDGTDPPQPAK